ncbi:MAG TPA: GDP-mannose 4,6-dehydratase, partial [Candidatus Polarisedimenticolaceae bacterium]|nr:GDP-mannose 4,6-dehydratase [Candidatus Polarisedimenticolaceae bacterium]
VARAHVLAAEAMMSGKSIKQAINLGTNHGSSVFEIIKETEKAARTKIPYRLADRRPGDSSTLIASNTLANEVLGWKPELDLKHIVADAVSWHNEFHTKAA